MGAPQIVVIVLLAIRLAVHAANDQKPTPADYNKYSFGRAFVQAAIWAGLLYWGGFFGSYAP